MPSPLKSPTATKYGVLPVAGEDFRVKVPSPLPQQDAHGVAAAICNGQIGDAVAVEISNSRKVWIVPGGWRRLEREGTIALAEQNAHRVAERVRDSQIGDAVAIKIANSHPDWIAPGGWRRLEREGTIALAEQNGDGVAVVVHSCEIGDSIA